MRHARNYLLVASMLAVLAFPSVAHAAGEVGPSAPARVVCDSITNTIWVKANVGGGAQAYTTNGQRVAWHLQLYNKTRGWTTLNSSLGQPWHTFVHKPGLALPVGEFGVNEYKLTTTYWAQTDWLSYTTFGDGVYYLYTRYIWEVGLDSGNWVDSNGYRYSNSSPGQYTQWYGNMLGDISYCQL